MYRVDDDVKAFVESGAAVVVGTADARGRPHIVWGWGPRVEDGRTRLCFCVENSAGETTFADLRATSRVALTFASPVSYRSLQLKGRLLGARPATEEDRAQVIRHREAFEVETALVGDPQNVIRNLWRQNGTYTALEVELEAAFDQTPGQNAGKPL